MRSHARAVVIGGGVVGVSVLYHLAKIGWTDVVLLEKNELTSGSTWHAAGGVTTLNSDANVSKLQKYTFDLYRELEQVTGQSCGIHHNGGIYLAASDGQMDFLKLIHSRARTLGMDTEMISVADAKARNVLIDERHFTGALWREDGGYVDPWLVTQAYVTAARQLGAEVQRFTKVEALVQRPDRTWDVVTDKGTINAEHVVNAGGLWAREVGRLVGLELPVLAMEHIYVVTEPVPALKGLPREIINTSDFTGEIYLRQEGEGVLLGTYEQACKVWAPKVTPDDFHGRLLPDDLERIAPELERGFRHFPALAEVGIKKVVNGPFTFSPDGNPLVGPVEGLPGFWCACAVMAGFSQGGGIGLVLSRWMAEGDPGQDVLAMDVARYGHFATPRYTSIKVQENYRRRFRLTYPNEEMPAARPLRRSPVYGALDAAGAVWGNNFGLESPLWFAPEGVAKTETPTYRRSEAFGPVGDECRAVRSAVGLTEITNYGKYEVTGRGARAFLDRVFACRIPRPGRMALAPMLSPRGRIIGDLTIACLAEDRYLIVGSGFAERFHMRWFAGQTPPDDVFVRAASSSYAGFALSGPKARDVLGALADFDVSAEGFRLFGVREAPVGLSPAIIQRCGFTGELGYEIWVTPDYLPQLYDDLTAAGQDFGLRLYGGRAVSSLRLEKNYGSFNKDFRPDYTAAETGLDAFVDFAKTVDFTGRAAVLAERETGPKRRFVTFKVDAPHADVVGYEVVLKDGRPVGHVTSGGWGHAVGCSLAMGYVPTALARDGETFAIDILGVECPAVITARPLYDPEGARLRS
ncbi:glycine cleavage system protein T [Prosthecomicrobium hirschii]|uniref:Glycine cleavage system protein T n=1 Tax=Prosthecodimorpha hirschii TaxID=665126 RepID=A0A0P6WF42_9HYPH|nr:FAD-dependent oxidoreductase [Prosthecomicrobium hirschii]KPL55027.1 glycine cleavage system protein T [Prosthecomicrobium hirschii]